MTGQISLKSDSSTKIVEEGCSAQTGLAWTAVFDLSSRAMVVAVP